VSRHAGIEVLLDAEAIGWHAEDTIAVDLRSARLLVDPAAVVLVEAKRCLDSPLQYAIVLHTVV
jgi:hypothetical protein